MLLYVSTRGECNSLYKKIADVNNSTLLIEYPCVFEIISLHLGIKHAYSSNDVYLAKEKF